MNKSIAASMWIAAGAALLGSSLAHAHGGVSIEFDTCVVEIGKYRMHFTAYQQATGGQEHCWDLPGPGKTILVFDFTDTEMRSKPVELRIVETGEGGEIAVARLPAKVYPQGAVNLESEFEAGKRYMAVLTMSAAQPVVLKAPIQVVPNQSYAALVGEPPEEFMSQPIIRTDAQVTVKEFIGDAGNTEWKKIEDNAWRLHSTELDKVTEKTRDIIMLFTRVEDGVEITRLIVDGNEHDRNTISHVVDRAVPLIIAAKYSGIWEYDENGTKSYVNITKEKSGRFKFIKGFKYEGKIGWSAHEVRNADGIYLKPLNGRLEGEFVSNNFYPTHGKDDRYKITLDAKSKTKLLYSVYSSMRGETDEREATKVSD